MKFLIIKIPDQVAFAILSSRYYRNYLTEYRAQCCQEVSKHELNNREWIDRVFKLLYRCFERILAVSLMANSFIVLIVYKTPTLRKPINYFIANIAISDLLYSIYFVAR